MNSPGHGQSHRRRLHDARHHHRPQRRRRRIVLVAVLFADFPFRYKTRTGFSLTAGKLQVDNVKVHKVPVQEDGVWTQVPRYTFDGMDIEETN